MNACRNLSEPKEKKISYSLDSVSISNWKLLMRFASLKTVGDCVYLFIVVWNTTPARNNVGLTKAFNEEVSDMIRIIGEINIPEADSKNYSSILDNYKRSRFSGVERDLEARNELVEIAWVKLEFENRLEIENQLKNCPVLQKQELSRMIFSRMKSFRSFATLIQDSMKGIQIEEVKKDNQEAKRETRNGPKDNNQFKEENEQLKNQVANLMKENARQQAALGNLTNVSWNEDDPNNASKLISDIVELQDMLDDFTMVQGSDFKINNQNAASILETYKCQTKYPDSKANLTLEAVLRHRAIEIILEDAQNHLQNAFSSGNNDPNTLESDIVNTTENLIKHIESFGKFREGDDDITKITPIKIRQNVYSALSCRGFSKDHPLIKETANRLLGEMNKYREVVDEDIRNELQDQAIQITYKIINVFCFRLKTQALEPTYRFFQAGDDVDARLMEGAFSETKNFEVEVCGFPCVSVSDDDNSNPRILTKARITVRDKSGDKSGIKKQEKKRSFRE